MPTCPSCRNVVAAPRPHDAAETTGKTEGHVRIAHLSDLHLSSSDPRNTWTFESWLRALASAQVDVLIVTGDVVDDPGDRASLQQAHRMLTAAGLPFSVVPGNHDVEDPGFQPSFESVFGRYPRVESHFGVELVLVDSMAGLPATERSTAERLLEVPFGWTEGRVGEAQLNVLRHQLAHPPPSMGRLLLLHHHLVAQPDEPVFADFGEEFFGTMKPLQDAAAVCSWARELGITTALHGHKHKLMEPGIADGGLLVLSAGSSTQGRVARLLDLGPDGSRSVLKVELKA